MYTQCDLFVNFFRDFGALIPDNEKGEALYLLLKSFQIFSEKQLEIEKQF